MMNRGTLDELHNWLKTLSPPRAMANDRDALALEMKTLERTVQNLNVKSADELYWIFQHIKEHAQTRSWPTAREIVEATNAVRGVGSGDIGKGDRSKLSIDELHLLENKVLPAARKWLTIPGLRDQGEATLRFWGETSGNVDGELIARGS